jgi:hypothetical protein
VNFWSNGKVMISIIAPGSHIHTFRLQLDPNPLSQYGKLVNYSGQGVEKSMTILKNSSIKNKQI